MRGIYIETEYCAHILAHNGARNFTHMINELNIVNNFAIMAHNLERVTSHTFPTISKPSCARNTALTTDRNTTYDVSHSLTFIFKFMYSCSQFSVVEVCENFPLICIDGVTLAEAGP